jgi:membrane protein DedA with SNARE-associated domain
MYNLPVLDSLTNSLLPWLETYGAFGVFGASIVEEVIAPIPSTLVVLFGGFLLVPETATVPEAMRHVALKVMLPASIGMSVGSLFPYFIARIGEKVAVDKFGVLLQVDWKMVDKARAYFEERKSDELMLFIARAVPVIPSVVIGVFCGLIRMPVRTFLVWSILGNLIRTFILGMVGWSVGAAYVRYAEYLSHVEDVVLVLVGLACIAAVAWWFRRRTRR